MSQHVGNGANRIVWWAAAILAAGYLAMQGWTAAKVVEHDARIKALETLQERGQ